MQANNKVQLRLTFALPPLYTRSVKRQSDNVSQKVDIS